jgi:hypothetical protein
MPAVIRNETKYSLIQSFRRWSERTLVEAAQADMYRAYPGAGRKPRHGGPVKAVVRFVFKTGFRVVPRPLRSRIMNVMLIRKGQDWDPA